MSNSSFKGETLSHILRALITTPGDIPGEVPFELTEDKPQATKPKEPKKADETDAEPQSSEKPVGSCKI